MLNKSSNLKKHFLKRSYNLEKVQIGEKAGTETGIYFRQPRAGDWGMLYFGLIRLSARAAVLSSGILPAIRE